MRSFLFVPADSERKLAKGPTSGADGLILDLEDSVATDRKKVARDMALAYLKSADRSGASVAVLVGQDEADAGEVTLRPLLGQGEQRRVPRDAVLSALRPLLDAVPATDPSPSPTPRTTT